MATVISNILTQEENLDDQIGRGKAYSKPIESTANYTAAGVLADNTVIPMVRLPVDAKLSSVVFSSTDLGTTGTVNIGFYPGNIKASDIVIGDALDEDAIALAIDVNAAAVTSSEKRFSASALTTADSTIWELAGLSSRPDYSTIYLSFTMSEITTAAGELSVKVVHSD